MRKLFTVVAIAAASFSAPSFAQSGTGVSGSAGLGTDLAGIVTSSTANPTISAAELGPIRGLIKWGQKRGGKGLFGR